MLITLLVNRLTFLLEEVINQNKQYILIISFHKFQLNIIS